MLVPVLSPKQSASVTLTVATSNGGSVIVAVAALVQPFKSSLMQIIGPAHKPVAVAVVCPVGVQS